VIVNYIAASFRHWDEMVQLQIVAVLVICYLAHSSLSAPLSKREACPKGFTLRDETCSVTCDYMTGKCEEKVIATECDCEGNKNETKSTASFKEGKLLKEEGDKKTLGSCEKLLSRCSTCKKINGTSGSSSSSASASKSELCGKAAGNGKGNSTKESTKETNKKEGKGGLDFLKFPKVPVFKFPEVPVIEEVDVFGIPIIEVVEEIGVGKKKMPKAGGKQSHHHHHHSKHEKKAKGHQGKKAQSEEKGNESKVADKKVTKKQDQDKFEVIMA